MVLKLMVVVMNSNRNSASKGIKLGNKEYSNQHVGVGGIFCV